MRHTDRHPGATNSHERLGREGAARADAARREIVARPVPALAATGFGFAAVIVVTGGRIGAAPAAVPLNHWLGLLPEAGYRITGVAMGVVMLAAIGALLASGS